MRFVCSGFQSPDPFPSPLVCLKTGSRACRRTGGLLLIALGVLAGSLISASAASAQTLTSVAYFTDPTGGVDPEAGLIADAHGNLFGTTQCGGANLVPTSCYLLGAGTVFEIKTNSTSSTGYDSTPTTLVSFNGVNGAVPRAVLMADASGNLYGTTHEGGAGYGTVFEIKTNSTSTTGYDSAPTILHTFQGNDDGGTPWGGLIADTNGNLYGTTNGYGAGGFGTVFEIEKDSTSTTGYGPLTTLIAFNITDGASPRGELIADGNGNLFGTTSGGTNWNGGTVYELKKNSTSATGYDNAPTVLYSFQGGDDGWRPVVGLLADASGNLFGTTYERGALYAGTVFELKKNSTSSTGYDSTATILYSFNSDIDGAHSQAALIADANGNLFGTTYDYNAAVFEIKKNTTSPTGYDSTATIVTHFGDTAENNSVGSLIADANGNLFGTDSYDDYYGGVFEITGSGFAPPRKFAGTPGSANCKGATISNLAQAYGGNAHAAASLGYSSVAALQSAVSSYCGQ